MGTKIIRLLMIGLTILIISGCALSEEDIIENISENMQTSFNRQSPEANQEFDHFNIYFPEHFTVVEESDSNLIFSDQDQAYILFYNILEPSTSDAFYLAEKERDYYTFLESYQDDDQFSYVKMVELDDNFALQVGRGGVRITTHLPLAEIEDTFDEIVQMLNSIEFHESDN